MSVRTLRYNTATQHFTKSARASTDRDALAFLEAAQIYNTNQQRAIVNLVRSLKRVGLWSKMKAIYPFVGGTASSHKWNLKDPRDVDAAFRLTFSGGWTHSSTGADPNGTNAYADSFLIPSTNLAIANHHISVYNRENVTDTTNKESIGAWQTTLDISLLIRPRGVGKATFVSGVNIYPQFTTANSQGFYLLAKGTATKMDGYKNLTKELNDVSATTSATGELPNIKLWLGALNYGNSALNYSNNQLAFATIGDDLTDSDATNLYNIVDLYQKRLGRAV